MNRQRGELFLDLILRGIDDTHWRILEHSFVRAIRYLFITGEERCKCWKEDVELVVCVDGPLGGFLVHRIIVGIRILMIELGEINGGKGHISSNVVIAAVRKLFYGSPLWWMVYCFWPEWRSFRRCIAAMGTCSSYKRHPLQPSPSSNIPYYSLSTALYQSNDHPSSRALEVCRCYCTLKSWYCWGGCQGSWIGSRFLLLYEWSYLLGRKRRWPNRLI